jgi:glycerol 3-phosphatase-2
VPPKTGGDVIADAYDAFLLDLDGVLYRGDRPVEGAAAAVGSLRAAGKRIAFVTNNASRTPEDVVAHLAGVGVAASIDEVETSALTTAGALRERGVDSVFVIGEDGLRRALAEVGLRSVSAGSPADAVVIGWDRSFTWDALRDASLALQAGAELFASNADATYPAPDGTTWPGAGSILAAVEAASGRAATVFGKPEGAILRAALARAGGGRPLVVGDRVGTDIEGARRLGWDSALVLTGISGRQDLRAAGITATYVLEGLSGLVEA